MVELSTKTQTRLPLCCRMIECLVFSSIKTK
jgi:hypothetical protein